MRSIDLYSFFLLGQQLQTLRELSEDKCPAQDYFFPSRTVRASVNELLKGDLIDAGVVVGPGNELLEYMDKIEKRHFRDDKDAFKYPTDDAILPGWELSSLKRQIAKFEHVLAAHTKMAATYYATKIGIFETGDLVERAEAAFPVAVRPYIAADAFVEYRAAGRALAFDMPTAAGFHVGRAVEIVLREYRNGFLPGNAGRTMGAMLRALTAHAKAGIGMKPDARTLRQVDQMRDLDRNRIMHPQDTLTPDQGLTMFFNGIAAITSMATEIASIKAGTHP